MYSEYSKTAELEYPRQPKHMAVKSNNSLATFKLATVSLTLFSILLNHKHVCTAKDMYKHLFAVYQILTHPRFFFWHITHLDIQRSKVWLASHKWNLLAVIISDCQTELFQSDWR